MKTTIQFQGKIESKEWPCYQWLIAINGESFEYRTGLAHATPKVNKFGEINWRKPSVKCVNTDTHWVHVPKIDDVLNCLFMDSQSGNESFDDFCDNLGYSNDSLKALDVYRTCMENAKKLRKALGVEYSMESKRIESLEL